MKNQSDLIVSFFFVTLILLFENTVSSLQVKKIGNLAMSLNSVSPSSLFYVNTKNFNSINIVSPANQGIFYNLS